jgi:type I restriction enzyme S subunit
VTGSLRLRHVIQRVGGTGFPPDEQGRTVGDFPFVKVSDFNLPGNERILYNCSNWISHGDLIRLRAQAVPANSIVFPKIGAALLGNARRVTARPTVFDNNVLGLVPNRISAKYLYYLLSTIDLGMFANPGPVPSLDDSSLLDCYVPVSSPTTQQAIAAFLDVETARIDALVAKKLRLVELIGGRHQAWLDQLFAQNSRRYRLKHLLKQSPCYGVLVPSFAESGVPFIRVNDITVLKVRSGTLVQINNTQSREYRRTVVRAGDVLLSVVGSIDKVAVVGPEVAGANVARAVARLVPAASVPSELLAQWLTTTQYIDQARLATSSDTAQPTLNMGDLANFEVSFPKPETREAVLQRSRAEIRRYRTTELLLLRQISLLQERRQALITTAVTGELEIPERAAG